MSNYVIFTDSSCDLSKEMIEARGIYSASLSFRFDGEDKEYVNNEMPIKVFYNKMREGGVAKTAAVNSETLIGISLLTYSLSSPSKRKEREAE